MNSTYIKEEIIPNIILKTHISLYVSKSELRDYNRYYNSNDLIVTNPKQWKRLVRNKCGPNNEDHERTYIYKPIGDVFRVYVITDPSDTYIKSITFSN